MIQTAFFNDNASIYIGNHGHNHVLDYVYGLGRQNDIASISNLYPEIVTSANFDEHIDNLSELEAIFSTWGMPTLNTEQIRQLPKLKWVFYAAGSTRGFREPFIEQGFRVMCATAANAIPVAEFCLAHILLGNKGFIRNSREAQDPITAHFANGKSGPGNYETKVALLGNGTIACKLLEYLSPFSSITPLVVDSFLDRSEVSLEEAFSKCQVVSNHFPDVLTLKDSLHEDLFRLLPQGATFINTGRGAQVDHAGLIRALKDRPDLTVILDVQSPEPPEEGSELYSLPNVHLSTHIAGSTNNEVVRMADYAISAFKKWIEGKPVPYEVNETML